MPSGSGNAMIRGEFIQVQCSLARLPEDDQRVRPYQVRERVLLADHRRTWLGRLAALTEHCEFRRGFVENATVSIDRFVGQAEELFRLAPLRRLHCRGSDWLLPRLLASPYLNRLEREACATCRSAPCATHSRDARGAFAAKGA